MLVMTNIYQPLFFMTFYNLGLDNTFSLKASLPILSFPLRTTLKLVVFIVASAALYESGQSALLTVFLLIVAAVFILKLHKVDM
ncbi:hypothetical protein JOC86_001159 [Bacillus pakistanensis]|uniref:Uncharacterized protein n=1 Tax=Rossellomorea pakistanensis TaxID=992288 RepID=A0ABS2N9U9_9BACI|nr:hypothetical protein [Bacillus pakistanensis]